jgi:thiol:disulfide interchange protein
MKRSGWFFLIFILATLACSRFFPSPNSAPAQVAANAVDEKNSALVNIYDPARDPADDLEQAILKAQKENKRIMLELGGDWCIWCKYMDDFYATHAEILQVRADNYVLVKVNVSEENSNDDFLAEFPAPGGYPHIYILDSDGTLLHSQDTVELEDGGSSYVPEVFMAFLKKWAPATN